MDKRIMLASVLCFILGIAFGAALCSHFLGEQYYRDLDAWKMRYQALNDSIAQDSQTSMLDIPDCDDVILKDGALYCEYD